MCNTKHLRWRASLRMDHGDQTKHRRHHMKKAALALSILAASTSAAWAQSSVQLYGIVDAGLRWTSNANAGSSEKQVIPGGMSQSRLGINVTEDMGGGLKAI